MRKKRDYKRDIPADSIYGSVALTRFINHTMLDGKKSVAQKVVYGALEAAAKKLNKDGGDIFAKAIENVSPSVEVTSRRVGGANYQVPRDVRDERRFFLACKWMLDAAKAGKGKPLSERLANEFIAAYNGEGEAIRKKENMHKMAEANRAFAHFAR
jgi:small subunit ribosomal protein S7